MIMTEQDRKFPLSNEALDFVVGGLNPQPLPPRQIPIEPLFLASQAGRVFFLNPQPLPPG
jgi:hypothetical protein